MTARETFRESGFMVQMSCTFMVVFSIFLGYNLGQGRYWVAGFNLFLVVFYFAQIKLKVWSLQQQQIDRGLIAAQIHLLLNLQWILAMHPGLRLPPNLTRVARMHRCAAQDLDPSFYREGL